MKLLDLENIKRVDQVELYDLTQISFTYDPELILRNYSVYVVEELDQMRMDLICFNIYGNTDYVDFLCNLNNIKNPLSVHEGMFILYVDENLVPGFRPDKIKTDTIREVISNQRKQSKPDPKRKKYNDNKSQSLPPSVTKKDYVPVKYRDGKIRIGEGIFKI